MSESEGGNRVIIGGDISGEIIVIGDNEVSVSQKHGIEGPDYVPIVDGVAMTDLSINVVKRINMMLRQLARGQISLSELKAEIKEEARKDLPESELKVRYAQANKDLQDVPTWEEAITK